MSLSDCMKCWETPCICGWEYRNTDVKKLKDQVKMLNKVIEFKEANPETQHSIFGEEIPDDKKYMDFINNR